jgi:5'-3' exonuclease
LKRSTSGFVFDLERAIDDWVFICFFVGNDFLPHLPSLDIREGALDSLVEIWKQAMPMMGGYVTEDGFVSNFSLFNFIGRNEKRCVDMIDMRAYLCVYIYR